MFVNFQVAEYNHYSKIVTIHRILSNICTNSNFIQIYTTQHMGLASGTTDTGRAVQIIVQGYMFVTPAVPTDLLGVTSLQHVICEKNIIPQCIIELKVGKQVGKLYQSLQDGFVCIRIQRFHLYSQHHLPRSIVFSFCYINDVFPLKDPKFIDLPRITRDKGYYRHCKASIL